MYVCMYVCMYVRTSTGLWLFGSSLSDRSYLILHQRWIHLWYAHRRTSGKRTYLPIYLPTVIHAKALFLLYHPIYPPTYLPTYLPTAAGGIRGIQYGGSSCSHLSLHTYLPTYLPTYSR